MRIDQLLCRSYKDLEQLDLAQIGIVKNVYGFELFLEKWLECKILTVWPVPNHNGVFKLRIIDECLWFSGEKYLMQLVLDEWMDEWLDLWMVGQMDE